MRGPIGRTCCTQTASSIRLVSTDAARSAAARPAATDAERATRTAWLAGCLHRARDGDLTALNEVVQQLNPLLWHVARSQGLAADDAADVVQTTWLELVRRLHDIRSPEALTGWLVTTARREAWRAANRRRGHPRPDPGVLDALPDPGPEPGERLEVDERHRVLLGHFARMSERCRALLRIVAMVDRPDYEVVAEALAMPRGSIGPTRGRCLAKLREALLADPAWSAR
jgi:RNA polymerase sigma factor (sigma-70 family)